VVQLLGILAGSPIMPPDLAGFGFVIIAIKPDLLMPEAQFRARVSEYAAAVRAARPVDPVNGPAVRMPFERSVAERRRTLAAGSIEVADFVYSSLVAASKNMS
jgi:LDH2 family malate/lactate/ureidoglycolate dehydrogenase